MARELKPQPVGDEIMDKDTGDKVQIMLNRNNKMFFFEYQGEVVEAKTYDELPAKVRTTLAAANNLVWNSVIEVSPWRDWNGGNGHIPTAQITYKRFQWAYRKDGRLMEREWSWREVFFEHPAGWYYGPSRVFSWHGHHNYRLKEGEVFAPPLYLENCAYLPYTDELWTGLEQITASIKAIQLRINDIVGTPDGTAILALVGAGKLLFLTAPPSASE